MVYLAKYTNIINLEEKVELTRPTAIQEYVERILPTEKYNNTKTFIKDHKPVLKELSVKNEIQLTYLLFTLAAIANKITPVLTLVQLLIETEIFENVKHQLMDVEYDDQNIEYQSKDVIAESSTKNSKKSYTKLNAKNIPKEKGRIVTFAEMASRNLDADSNCNTSLTPPVRKVAQVYTS
ncbi:hypothetical protein RhiirA5_442842 [Rhizophagus irregularis]|uniref:Uncharacterized protein n=1 Tax=Rhizophagus irregularis TaxID=588596 RepID=A0A2N0QL16_9GLOM|nr:hypothetical protein RhiirA5_442842 [Rhizophagus irregularis]PKC51748.1 hypothetical protein RhiirA1_483080 [Rhizophagus irregularis]